MLETIKHWLLLVMLTGGVLLFLGTLGKTEKELRTDLRCCAMTFVLLGLKALIGPEWGELTDMLAFLTLGLTLGRVWQRREFRTAA